MPTVPSGSLIATVTLRFFCSIGTRSGSGVSPPIHLAGLQRRRLLEAKFLEVFNKLQKDASLKAPELKRLARDFAKAAAKTKADGPGPTESPPHPSRERAT